MGAAMRSFDAIVIGAGVMGVSTMLALARRGLRVLGIERFHVAHDRGSSHGRTRIIRKAYFEHPGYVPLLHRAYELWARIEAESSRRLVWKCGLMLAGPADGAVIAGVRRAACEHHLAIESVPAADVGSHYPGFRVVDAYDVLYEADAGFIRAEEAVETIATLAASHGAALQTGETVERWSADGKGVYVETMAGRYTAAALVLCPGAWAASLLGGLNLPLQVRRKVACWFSARDDAYRLDRGCPVFGFETHGGFFYGFPTTDGEQEVKVAEHTGGDAVEHADAIDRTLRPSDASRVSTFLADCLPGVDPTPLRHTVCMYTMTPDEHFIVDRHPARDNVFLAAGFSGHGFKFGPVVGEVLADLVTIGRTDAPVGFLSAARPALTACAAGGDPKSG